MSKKGNKGLWIGIAIVVIVVIIILALSGTFTGQAVLDRSFRDYLSANMPGLEKEVPLEISLRTLFDEATLYGENYDSAYYDAMREYFDDAGWSLSNTKIKDIEKDTQLENAFRNDLIAFKATH